MNILNRNNEQRSTAVLTTCYQRKKMRPGSLYQVNLEFHKNENIKLFCSTIIKHCPHTYVQLH